MAGCLSVNPSINAKCKIIYQSILKCNHLCFPWFQNFQYFMSLRCSLGKYNSGFNISRIKVMYYTSCNIDWSERMVDQRLLLFAFLSPACNLLLVWVPGPCLCCAVYVHWYLWCMRTFHLFRNKDEFIQLLHYVSWFWRQSSGRLNDNNIISINTNKHFQFNTFFYNFTLKHWIGFFKNWLNMEALQ